MPSIRALAVAMVSLPPSGMASRALMARLSSALSSWFGSHSVHHSPADATMSRSIRLADGPAQQILQRHHQRVGIDGFRNQRLAPRKRQQAMGQRRGAVGRRHRRVDVARDILGPPLIEPGLHQIQRSDDSGQQIVEVVGDAAGQLPDGFHLLRLAQRLFGGLQAVGRRLFSGDVAGDRVDAILVRHAGPRQPAIRSVLVAEAALEPDGGVVWH